MKMGLQDKMATMEKAIADLVASTLSSIRKDLAGTDFKDENFKTFFLDCAKNRILNAYNAYVIEAEFDNRNRIGKPNNRASNDDAQETKVSQSTLKDDDIESIGSPEMDELYCSVNSTEYEPTITRPNFLRSTPHCQHLPNRGSEDISEIRKCSELQLQKKCRNTLDVQGLPIRKCDEKSLRHLFKIFCDHISEPFDPKDIENIQSDGRSMMVTFRDEDKADLLLASQQTKNLQSDKVLKLLPGEKSTSIKVFRKLTAFYTRICHLAQDYVRKKQIFSYGICSQGLAIRLTPTSQVRYVRSRYELKELVCRNGLKRKSSDASAVAPKQTKIY